MSSKIIKVILMTIIAFVAIFYLNTFIMLFYKVQNIKFVWQFYEFLTLVSSLMMLSVVLVYIFKTKYVGYTFLSWSMLKLMLVMGFFIIFVLRPKLPLNNADVFAIISLYFSYLIFEVLMGVYLLKEKNPAG
jgi:cytochrome c oxidase assembly factor CtaG